MSRIRQATNIDLPTSGHIVSHNPDEIREELSGQNLQSILILDDTSFSGNTNLIVENLVKQAFPEKTIQFTHGFLILNTGELGPNPGAQQRLHANGDTSIGGLEMRTPRDDGWHFFDLVKHQDIENHLLAVREILSLVGQPNFEHLASALLSDEKVLRLVFPNLFTTEELEKRRTEGHFIGTQPLYGEFHVRNPQLLPTIIGQGHLLPPEQWQGSQKEVFGLLAQLSTVVRRRRV